MPAPSPQPKEARGRHDDTKRRMSTGAAVPAGSPYRGHEAAVPGGGPAGCRRHRQARQGPAAAAKALRGRARPAACMAGALPGHAGAPPPSQHPAPACIPACTEVAPAVAPGPGARPWSHRPSPTFRSPPALSATVGVAGLHHHRADEQRPLSPRPLIDQRPFSDHLVRRRRSSDPSAILETSTLLNGALISARAS